MVNKSEKDCLGARLFARGPGRRRADEPAMPREEILQLAFSAFARQGYEGVSMRALAADCGLSNTMLHHHFGTKLELWFEAVDSVLAPLHAGLMAIFFSAQPEAPILDVLRGTMTASLRLAGENGDALAFIFREGDGDNERAEYLRVRYVEPYVARCNSLMTEGKASGELANVSEAAMHAIFTGTMRQLIMPGVLQRELATHLGTNAARERLTEQIVDLLVACLVPPVAVTPANFTRETKII